MVSAALKRVTSGLTLALFGLGLQTAQPTYGFDNWLSLRDQGVVRQQRDYSCGAAALATLLTHYYHDPVSENALLQQAIGQRVAGNDGIHQPRGLSFLELAKLAQSRGYPAIGIDVFYTDLKKLAVPVIVALQIADRAHFTVLRKIDEQDRVFLADPSWGNRQLGRDEFLERFARDDALPRGRILIIGADEQGNGYSAAGDDAFRHRLPRRVLMAPRP